MITESQVPMDLYYTDNHTWVLIEDMIGIIGITDYAQSELSEIVYIELPVKGSEIVQGTVFGTIEAMKTIAELIAPVSGTILEVNEALDTDPRIINNDPYGDGWIIKVHLNDPVEVDNIMTPDDYVVFISDSEEEIY